MKHVAFPLLAIFCLFTVNAAAQTPAKKRVKPRLDAEITEIGSQAVLSNIHYQTSPENQKAMTLGIGFFVVDAAIVTGPAGDAVCRRFGYADAESVNWETNLVEEDDLVYLADPRSLEMRMSFGKDLPKKDDARKIKHLQSVICRV